MKKFGLPRSIYLIILLVLISCNKEDEREPIIENPLNITFGETENGDFGEFVYQTNTIVLDDKLKNHLKEVNQDYISFNYSKSFEMLRTGDVLFSNETELAPDGFARKVVSIEKSNQIIKFYTSQAEIEDVFEIIDYKQELDFDITSIENTTKTMSLESPENKSASKTSSPSITINTSVENEKLKVSVIIDKDTNLSTKYDQLTLSGNIEIEHNSRPNVEYYYNFFFPDLNVFSLTGLSTVNFNADLTYGGQATKDWIEDDFKNTNGNHLAFQPTFEFARLPLTSLLSPSNLIIKPYLVISAQLSLDINGKFHVGFSYSLTYQYIIDYRGKYTGNGWNNSITRVPTNGAQWEVGASAEINYEANPFIVGTVLTFPQFISFSKKPPHLGIFVYPWTQTITAKTSYDSFSSCFKTEVVNKNSWKTTLEAEISSLFMKSEKTLSLDLTLISQNYDGLNNKLEIEDFCFFNNAPTLTTTSPSNITQTSTISGGNITSNGGSNVTLSGVCWSITSNPTINDNTTSNGGGTGSFTSNILNLTSNTTYYLKAYATNSKGTGYGQQKTFTTLSSNESTPTLTTITPSNKTQTSATSGGNISSDGGNSITSRGVCWSTNPSPTISSNKTTNGSGKGSFTSTISNLSPNTRYYIRAYAINSKGPGYGEQKTFTTLSSNESIPTLTTTTPANKTQTSATSGGNISSDGGNSITSRGVCWSTNPSPTISNNKTTDGSGKGSFTSTISNLSPNTTYYIRAYAINSKGPGYGEQKIFTTLSSNESIPTLTTTTPSNKTQTSATSGGNISSDGGNSITSRGVCWSTNPSPTISNNKTTDGSGKGSFTSTIPNLNPNTTYYIRAYAVNSKGPGYGDEKNFTTTSSTDEPILEYVSYEIDDDTSGGSDGNNNNILEAGEDIELEVQIQNIGNATATNVSAVLSTNDSDINITDFKESYGTITEGSSKWNSDFDFTINPNCPSKTINFTLDITSDEGDWTSNFSIEVVGQENDTSTPITPSDDDCSAPIMQINKEYSIDIDISNYGLGNAIDGESSNGGKVRGFWLAFQVPPSQLVKNIIIYDVTSNFDPVVGVRTNCNYTNYLPNINTEYKNFANQNGNGGTEDFLNNFPNSNDANNDGLYYIRIYHYNENETPTISFKIKFK